jgi:L-amino acid N-acyltransferase YncA
MDLMVKLANAKNALQAVRTAKNCLEFTEFVSYKDFIESATYKLSGAEFKLERDVEFLQNLFDNTYVTRIVA